MTRDIMTIVVFLIAIATITLISEQCYALCIQDGDVLICTDRPIEIIITD